MTAEHPKQSCDRCGSCCMQGGPALHSPDLRLLEEGYLTREHLVTVRKGELAFQPMETRPSPVREEFLKLQGKAGSWCCGFYDETARACTIYGHRPMACGLLDCTAPEALLAITGKDLLSRFDVIEGEDALLPLVRRHEEACACPDMEQLLARLQSGEDRAGILEPLSKLINRDLALRGDAAAIRRLTVGDELFYFGRPLFQLLLPLGIQIRETASGLQLL